jgi:hypothetical protein
MLSKMLRQTLEEEAVRGEEPRTTTTDSEDICGSAASENAPSTHSVE